MYIEYKHYNTTLTFLQLLYMRLYNNTQLENYMCQMGEWTSCAVISSTARANMHAIPNYVNHVTSLDQLNDRCLLFESRACLPCSISVLSITLKWLAKPNPSPPRSKIRYSSQISLQKNMCCLACLNTFQA